MPNATTTPYRWRFFRAGGFNQVVLGSGADLLNLDQLDQKLWVALACPTTGVEFDQTTLALIDTDKDGRIRVPELIAAVQWAGGLMKNPDDLLNGNPTLRPSAINDATPEGKLIANFARQVLGKSDAGEITFDEAAAAAQNFAAKPFNGDGIVPADSASDDLTRAVITDIITCLGADTDASGKPGVSQAKVWDCCWSGCGTAASSAGGNPLAVPWRPEPEPERGRPTPSRPHAGPALPASRSASTGPGNAPRAAASSIRTAR